MEFNEQNGGIKATHIGHNIDKNKGWYETDLQKIGFNHGHAVIFEKEVHNVFKKRDTEGSWDGKNHGNCGSREW